MITITEITATILENSPFFVMMRVLGISGLAINQASVSGIAAKVYEISGPTPTVATQNVSLTVGAVVFDELQTDARWTRDGIGYNFGHAVPAAWVPLGGARFDLEYKITPVTGDPYFLPRVRVRTVNYASS